LSPLGAFHRVHARNELDMQIVAAAFAGIATRNECCVTFGNPLTKGTREPSGAADLLYAMRCIRIVTPMTTEQADKFGIAVRERSRYVRVESKTGPVINETWYRLDGADLIAVPLKPRAARRAVVPAATCTLPEKRSRRSRRRARSLEAKPLGSAA
jgi:hypothetical protein